MTSVYSDNDVNFVPHYLSIFLCYITAPSIPRFCVCLNYDTSISKFTTYTFYFITYDNKLLSLCLTKIEHRENNVFSYPFSLTLEQELMTL